MKKFSVWFFSLIVLFYSFASTVPVKASSPSSYQVDYSSLYSASQISGILPTLSSSAAGGFFATLGSLAYSYLRSVNVNIVPSSSSMSPTDAMITLGKKVIETVTDVTQPNRLLWKGLNSGTQYLVTSLLKDAQSGDLTQSNYTDQVFVWKDQVSKPMSDIFNVFDPVVDLWAPDPDAFVSASNSSLFFSDLWNAPLSAFSGDDTSVIFGAVHSNLPSLVKNEDSFNPSSTSWYSLSSANGLMWSTSVNSGYEQYFYYDSIIIPSTFSSSNYYSFMNGSDSLYSFSGFPIVFFNSVNQTFCVFPTNWNNRHSISLVSSVVSSGHLDKYGSSYRTLTGTYGLGYAIEINSSGSYSYVDLANYLLGFSSTVPSYFTPSFTGYRYFTNINLFVADFDQYNHCDISTLKGFSTTPSVSIDATNNYVDRQLPIDNVDNTDATLNLASVIDNLAGSIDGTLSNIDFLTDAINGLVGTVPQVSVDSWNPDRVSEHVTSTDIASAIDGVASLEGTFTDNVQPVFDNFPLFPFIAPIWNTFQQFPVIGLITACIFLVVLFGFLNKLLF